MKLNFDFYDEDKLRDDLFKLNRFCRHNEPLTLNYLHTLKRELNFIINLLTAYKLYTLLGVGA